jgi:F0F1-type ATP synthase membrane subunit b/b'
MSDTQSSIIAAAAVVGAAAIVVQMAMMIAMYYAMRALQRRTAAFMAKAEPVVENAQRLANHAQQLLEETRKHASDISAQAAEVMALTRKELTRVDEVLADRIEMVLDDTVNRFQETTALLQNGIVKPIRQISGLTLGVRTALAVLFNGHRRTVEQATQDDEMFI